MWCGRNEGVPQPLISDGLAQVQDDGTRYYTPSSNRINLRGSGPYQYQDPAFYFDTLDQGFAVELGVPSLSTPKDILRWPLDDIFAGPAVDAPVFLRLKLVAGDRKVLSSNFYWLTKHDEDLRRLNIRCPRRTFSYDN